MASVVESINPNRGEAAQGKVAVIIRGQAPGKWNVTAVSPDTKETSRGLRSSR